MLLSKRIAIMLILVMITSIVIPGLNPMTASAAALNIVSYGATANDSSDDTSAIQSAINAASLGDTVYIPNGIFNVSNVITVKSGIKLEGQSQSGAILKFTGTSPISNLIQMNNTSDVELTKFTIDGHSNDNLHNGIWGEPVARALVHFITVKDLTWHEAGAFGPHGLLFAGASDSEVSDSTFINMGVLSGGGSGMRIGYNSTRIKILRNTIANTGEGGIRCNDNSTDFIIRNNTVTGSGLVKEGLSIECYADCQRFIVEDNQVDTFLSVARCDYTAVRRNTISDKSGRHITIGLEAASSNNIYTDNLIDDGHTVGLSASWQENYQFLGYNTFKAENMWGAQLQGGDSSHLVKNQYFFNCNFINQTMGEANPPYPGYEGYGFRINGNTDYVEFENCNFNGNARYGLQFGGGNVNHISLRNCNIQNNGTGAFEPNWSGYTGFEMVDCNVSGNGSNNTPASSPFNNQRPVAILNSTDAGAGTINFSSSSYDPDGTIAHVLWDFGDGIPTDSVNPSHTYPASGTYRVNLVVWDNQGRAERDEAFITVDVNSTPTEPVETKLAGSTFGTSPTWNNDPNTTYAKAYDGNTSTFFDYAYGNGGYTGIDLGAGNEHGITKIRFFPRATFEGRMTGGKFQVSNTSSSSGYTDIYTISSIPSSGWNEVTLSIPDGYRYLRYMSPDNSYGNVAEVEFYGEPADPADPTDPTDPPEKVFSDDFNGGNAAGWTTYSHNDTWAVVNNQYTVQGGAGDKAVADETVFTNFTYEADVQVGASNDAGIIFRVTNPSVGSDSFNGYYLGINAQNDQAVLARMGSGSYYQIAGSSVAVNADTMYHLKVVAQGSSIKIYINNVLTIDASDSTWASGAIGVRAYFTNARFDNIVVSN